MGRDQANSAAAHPHHHHQHHHLSAHHPANATGTRNAKNKKLFPQKLWDLINDHKYHFCLKWSDDGQLVYLNRDQFEDAYLKTPENQFHTQKAISFVRQMNMYGFRKVDDCYYENDNFKRNCPHLLKNMIRKHPNKGPAAQPAQPLPPPPPPKAHHQLAAAAPLLGRDRSSPATSDQQPPVALDATTGPRQRNNNQHKEVLYLHQLQKHQLQEQQHQQHQQQQQLINTQLPTDLTMTPQESRHLNNLSQPNALENSNLNVLYTLLAAINSNLYQPMLLNQQSAIQAAANNSRALDVNRFAELQQVYQHLFDQLLYKAAV